MYPPKATADVYEPAPDKPFLPVFIGLAVAQAPTAAPAPIHSSVIATELVALAPP